MPAVNTLEYAMLGRPRRVARWELPRLAWMLSVATANRLGWILAPFVYISNLEGLRQRASIGSVWHSDARLLLVAMPVGGPHRQKISQPWWFSVVILGSFIIGLFDEVLGAALLLASITLLVLLLLPTLFMLPKLLAPSTRRAHAAIKDWSNSSQSQAYVLSLLVKDRRIEWGAGVPFVEAVIREAKLPLGTPVAAVAGTPKQERFLKALGFQPLEHDGVPTRAMARWT
ncbi:hypothetical protein CQ020_01910 [Arthrobacter sp. MYb23]|uniref:hypothetical protein n=1 Tax=unclassified Arthrobacter TaxID=235627 RepID=UPI000CFC7A25|nr:MULTISPECIES: hypothetical protein [unclassified Arthrobacter]PRB44975.1 hypothetical protein CQ038_00870 [Arthrobacter sp. MYb51]PRB99562.1 hypothetical protein CQ020_01910 [Arthrobacter sp. MYb23]